MSSVSAIVPAAGSGRRFGSKTSKLFFKVEGKPVLFYTLKNLSEAYSFKEIFVAAAPAYFGEIEKIGRILSLRSLKIIFGGATRAESVHNALLKISSDWALVHDAARPLVNRAIVLSALKAARLSGGAVSAIPATATVKRVGPGGTILCTEDRETLYLAQTPQVFKKEDLLRRYRQLGKKAFKLTDEASFFDGTGVKVRVAEGAVSNLKITTPEDIELFRFYLNARKRG